MPIPLDGIGLGAAGIRSTEYGYIRICANKKQGAIIPLLKVLAVKGLLSRSPLWVWAKPKVLRETRRQALAAEIRSTEYGYIRICTNKKQGAIIPLLKVLESLENFFQEVFKQGLGQSPKVFPLTPCGPAPQAAHRRGTRQPHRPPRGGTRL